VKTQKLPLFLRRTLSESANVLAIAAAQKSVELVVDVDPDVPDALTGNGLLLRQMILHLAGNAVKFTERGEVVISAAVASSEAESVSLVFSVRDTGVGMSQQQLDSLFEPFEPRDTSDASSLGGTGFGLAITRRLAALMGDRVWAESERGVGSTFHFTATFGLQKTVAARKTGALKGRRIFLVDDNASARYSAARILVAHGAQVSSFGGCGEAEEQCTASPALPFDDLIVDSLITEVIGETGGGGMIERTLRHGVRPDQIVMLLPASQLQASRQLIARFGVTRYLVKPLVEERLIEMLREKPLARDSSGTCDLRHMPA